MGILGIDTVAIVVSNRHQAIRWYRDVLGLDVAYIGPNDPNADPSSAGTPENAGHWIELGPRRPRARIHICEMEETEPGPTGITFLTDDIGADYERLRAKGAHFTHPPEKMDWGEWIGEFEDPDGNVFDLKQPISTEEWRDRSAAGVKRARPGGLRPSSAPGRRKKRPRRTARAS